MSTACELERAAAYSLGPGLSSIYCERLSRCCYEEEPQSLRKAMKPVSFT